MSTRFVIYDLITGKIKRVGRCQDHMVAAQAQDGEGVLKHATATDLDHRVDPGTGTIIPAPEVRAARDVRRQAQRDARRAAATADLAKLNAILNNPQADPNLKTIASIVIERLIHGNQ